MSDGVEVVAERPQRRRVLITGLSSYWGGRLAEALESFAEVEAIVGVDTRDPTRELERTEFVKVSNQHGLIQRIVRAARIDTVIDARLVVDSITTSRQRAHENNVIGTMNVLAACAGEGSPVRRFVFKSSAHVYGAAQNDPAFFTEAMTRSQPPATPIERDVVEAEASVVDFAGKQKRVDVTVLRCANVLGPDVRTSFAKLLSLPLVPMIAGFDPRLQFVHEDDIVHALEHATVNRIPGVFNVAADGVLALSEIVGLLGKRPLPVLPPWGAGLLNAPLRALRVQIPPEMRGMLRFGRGIDNRRYKASGFEYGYTTREAALAFSEHLRLQPILRGVESSYTYEGEVERFLRRSPLARPPRPDGEESGTAQEPFGI